MSAIVEPPDEFWTKHVSSPVGEWFVEDSAPVSNQVDLSVREVPALVLLAHVAQAASGHPWVVGFDDAQPEPNDGFIARADNSLTISIESKLIPRFNRDVLDGILNKYQETVSRVPGTGGI